MRTIDRSPPLLRRMRLPAELSAPLTAALVTGSSLLVAARELGLLDHPLGLPLRYADVDDTKFYLALFKGVIEHGSWTTNPSLGFPFGQQLYDFPQGGDNLNLVLVRALGVFSHNPALVANLFLLLTFPLATLSAFVVLRQLGISNAASAAVSVIFALLPYHFASQRLSQLLLAAYYSVPLSAYLFLRVVGDERLFSRRDGRGWLTRRSLVTALLCVVIGSAGFYYACFAIVLLLAGAIVVVLVRRNVRAILPGFAAIGLVALTLAVNLGPSLVDRLEHGSNPRIARTTTDSRDYGLEPVGLVLPVRGHRLGFLSKLNADYFDPRGTQSYCEACYETLGTVGDVGFAWLIGLGILSIAGVVGARSRFALERRAALGVALTLTVSTVSGVSGLIALLVTKDVRGWNRMSLFIAFFSLLAVALLLDRGRGWLRRRRRPVWIGLLAIAAVLTAGVLDETSPFFLQVSGQSAREWRSDAAFVKEIEARMPRGAAIFQLPQVPFPEGYSEPPFYSVIAGGGFDTSYELMRGYIHSNKLRWSYGAMKGRAADWASALATKPLRYALDAAAAAGFDGLWIDRRGYGSHNLPALQQQLAQLPSPRPLFSRLRDLEFLDLRPLRAMLEATRPPRTLRTLHADSLNPLRTTCTATGLLLDNPSPERRAATLSFDVYVNTSDRAWVAIRFPDGTAQHLQLDRQATSIVKPINLAHGQARVTFSYAGVPSVPHEKTDGPAVAGADLTDAELRAFRPLRVAGFMAGITPPPCIQVVSTVQEAVRFS